MAGEGSHVELPRHRSHVRGASRAEHARHAPIRPGFRASRRGCTQTVRYVYDPTEHTR